MTLLVVRFGAPPLRDTAYPASSYRSKDDGAKSGYGEAPPIALHRHHGVIVLNKGARAHDKKKRKTSRVLHAAGISLERAHNASRR
jgi:hypothetical protein